MSDNKTVFVTGKELKEAFESRENYNRFCKKLAEKLKEKENEEKDKIKSTIVESLETAKEEEIAYSYVQVVRCRNCSYQNDCWSKHCHCYDYILEKLKSEENKNEVCHQTDSV